MKGKILVAQFFGIADFVLGLIYCVLNLESPLREAVLYTVYSGKFGGVL